MAEFLTDDQREAYVAALTRELEGYQRTGNAERADQVTAELDRLSGTPKARRGRKPKAEAPAEGGE